MPHLTDDEMKVSIFAHNVTLGSVCDAIMDALSDAAEEYAETSRLRIFQRRRLDREMGQLHRLLAVTFAVKRRNEQAS